MRYGLVVIGATFYVRRGAGARRNPYFCDVVTVVSEPMFDGEKWRCVVRVVRPRATNGQSPQQYKRRRPWDEYSVAPSRLVPFDARAQQRVAFLEQLDARARA